MNISYNHKLIACNILGRSLSSAVFLPYIKTKIYCT